MERHTEGVLVTHLQTQSPDWVATTQEMGDLPPHTPMSPIQASRSAPTPPASSPPIQPALLPTLGRNYNHVWIYAVVSLCPQQDKRKKTTLREVNYHAHDPTANTGQSLTSEPQVFKAAKSVFHGVKYI